MTSLRQREDASIWTSVERQSRASFAATKCTDGAAKTASTMTVVETPGSHALYVSHPEPVARLIAQAAAAVSVTADQVAR